MVTDFKSRQEKLLGRIDHGAFIIPSAKLKTKSNDTEFPFRQNSFFKYFVGFDEDNALLVLKKERDGSIRRFLFVEPKDPTLEMWAGIRLGKERALELLEVDETYDNTDIEEKLPHILSGVSELYFNHYDLESREMVLKASQTLSRQRKNKSPKPHSWKHSLPLMGELRLVKDQSEIQAMKKAAKLTDVGMRAAMALSQPGVNEKEINTLLTYLFNQEQGEGPAYDSIVAGGENALILHYINNNMTLKEGDLLLIDAGAQVNTYASDVTRTFPVNGKFTEAQAELYSLVLDSQKAAMAHMKIGNTLGSIHLETSKALATSLKDAGILSGSLDEIMETGSYRTYYPHGTGHWLGLDVHDESPYLIDEGNDTLSDVCLEEGMAFTCEPGLYFPADDKNVPSKWRGIGIRIEDDLIMNESGFTNITSSIPKEIKEVEEACQGDLKSILNKLETLPLMAK